MGAVWLLAYVLRERPSQQLYINLVWENNITRRDGGMTGKIVLTSAAWIQVTILKSFFLVCTHLLTEHCMLDQFGTNINNLITCENCKYFKYWFNSRTEKNENAQCH